MAIYVKEKTKGNATEGFHYVLFADAAHELLWPTLSTANEGTIICQPGSTAYTLEGTALVLGSNDTWTAV